MSDDDEQPQKKKGGIFGRKRLKKKDSTGDGGSRGGSSRGGSSYARESSMDGDSTINSDQEKKKRKKKKGIGRHIKRMVVGRKKNKKDDDGSAVEFLDKNDPNYRGPRTSLDPDILKQVMEDEDEDTPRGGRFGPDGRAIDGAIDEGDEDEDMDIMSYGEEGNGGDQDEPGDLMFPVALVLLLVDPDTLRFELLQLEFETPQEAKVGDVLDQIKDSITEPSIRALDFYALVDRKGSLYPATTALAKALTNRKRSKDILVALSKGLNTDQCSRLARPIFADAKVITMLESNGYNVKGWAKNKQEESELPDTKPDTFAVSERKRQLRLTTVLLGGLFVAYVFYRLFHYFFDPAAPIAAALEEGIEETLDNTTFLNATDSQPILDLEGTLVEEVMVDAQPEMA